MDTRSDAGAEMVEVGGCRLFTKVDGEAPKPWLLLSNSLASDHTLWDGQVEELTHTHRVLRYDARGHGRSSAPDGPYSFDHLTGDVLSIMAHYGIEQAAFMGISLGGMVGLGLAINHPGRLTRLVCCDARADAPAPFVAMWASRIIQVRESGIEPIVDGTIERWLSPAFQSSNLNAIAPIAAMVRGTTVQGYIGCAAALGRLAYLPFLGRIDIPTLFLVGEEDQAVPPQVMQAMAAQVPGACFVSIPGAAHLPNLDSAAAFMAAVREFL